MLREQFYPTPQGYKGMGSTSRTSTTLQALEYVGISFKNILNVRNYLSQYNERLNFFLNDHFPARKEPAYSSARCYIVYSSEWNTKLESLFYDIGLVDAVANQVEQIKFKIKELEDEVIQEEVNNINLLNI